MSGSADAIRFLLGRDVTSLEAADLEGCSALHLAAGHRLGSDGTLTALLIAGADIEARTFPGETALHKACKALRASAVQVLLRWGANEAAVDAGGHTPAAMASLLLKSQCPGVFHDMLGDILDMLVNAPADRTWRRRGWLLLLRARRGFQDGLSTWGLGGDNPGVCVGFQRQSGSIGVLGRLGDGGFRSGVGYEGRPTKMGKENAGIRSATAMLSSYGVAGVGPLALSLGRGGAAGRRAGSSEAVVGARDAEFCSVVERAVGLDEDGVFRRIVAYM